MPDVGFENQIPPGNPLSCQYDVLVNSEEMQEGLVTVSNLTLNRDMDIVIMAQVIQDQDVLKEDTQFSHVNPLGFENGGDAIALKFQFDVSDLESGNYSIIIGTWPKGHREQKVVCIGNNFTIGDIE